MDMENDQPLTFETDGEKLARLGTDATAWAAEFAATLLRLESESADNDHTELVKLATDGAPGSLVHVWFVNAIEAGIQEGRDQEFYAHQDATDRA